MVKGLVSMKISDTPFLKTMPPILPTPLFLWKKFEPPLILKILKTQPFSLLPFIKGGGGGRGGGSNCGQRYFI